MTVAWNRKETTTHQDHIVAHVLGTTVRGYFIYDEALYILLDIGFIWTILLDGEMGLLPHPVAVGELEIEAADRDQIRADIDALLDSSSHAERLFRFKLPPAECQIEDVSFFAAGDRRRFVIAGETADLVIETSLRTAEVQVMTVEEKGKVDSEGSDTKLEDVARTEHDYLHQRLREELGREPTEAELDDWLRQHTEGY